MEKPFAPLADDLPWEAEALGDLLVPQPLRGEENGLCPRDIAIR